MFKVGDKVKSLRHGEMTSPDAIGTVTAVTDHWIEVKPNDPWYSSSKYSTDGVSQDDDSFTIELMPHDS